LRFSGRVLYLAGIDSCLEQVVFRQCEGEINSPPVFRLKEAVKRDAIRVNMAVEYGHIEFNLERKEVLSGRQTALIECCLHLTAQKSFGGAIHSSQSWRGI
jgi:hypothetical protein